MQKPKYFELYFPQTKLVWSKCLCLRIEMELTYKKQSEQFKRKSNVMFTKSSETGRKKIYSGFGREAIKF